MVFTFADYCKRAEVSVPHWAEHIVMPKVPFRHQIDGLREYTQFPRFGEFSQMGTGKTLSAQAYALWAVSHGNKVVVTMPPTLIPQFMETLSLNYWQHQAFVRSDAFTGGPADRDEQIEKWQGDWPDILAMSYMKFIKHRDELLARGYTLVIVDEATAVKNCGSNIHKAVKIFGGNVRNDSNGILLMTGSPVETNVMDAYGIIATINPDRYGSERYFKQLHCVMSVPDSDNKYSKVLHYKNYDYLHASLMSRGRRILKSQVFDLPPRLISEIKIGLSPKHRDLYYKLVNEKLAEVGDRVLDLTERSALYQAVQRSLLCPEMFTDEPIDNVILETLDTYMDSLESEKVVMYVWYTESVKKLMKRYAHRNPTAIYSEVTGKKREASKQKFITDPSCTLVICNFKSGGIGVDGFQTVSSHAVYPEVCPWPGVFQQSVDRLHRGGQNEVVNVYMFVPMGTIAVKLRNDLIKKDREQEMAMRDGRTILKDLYGDGGLQGSLDNLKDATLDDYKNSFDKDH